MYVAQLLSNLRIYVEMKYTFCSLTLVIQYASAFYGAIFVILLFLSIPKTRESLPYRKAKACLATTYFLMDLNLTLWLLLYHHGQDSWKKLYMGGGNFDSSNRLADLLLLYGCFSSALSPS